MHGGVAWLRARGMKRPDVTQRVYLCAPAAFRARRAGGGGHKVLIAAPGGWARRRGMAERQPHAAAKLPAWQATLRVDLSPLMPAMRQYAHAYRAPIIGALAASTAAMISLYAWHAAPQTARPLQAVEAVEPTAPVVPDAFADVRGSVIRAPVTATALRSTPGSTLGLSDSGTIVVVAEPRAGRADGFNLDITSPGNLWAKTGARYRIDPVLIYAVALVETRGLQPDGSVAPSPWVVRINGHLHSGTRKETEHAIELANLLAVPVQDVGIMQVYYPVHRDIEPDPIALLNPARNIEIGTRLLHQAMRESTDPVLRIGYYHSHDAGLARGYGELVLNVYRELKTAMGKSPARAVALASARADAERPGGS